jgi:hypothetical protein
MSECIFDRVFGAARAFFVFQPKLLPEEGGCFQLVRLEGPQSSLSTFLREHCEQTCCGLAASRPARATATAT